MKTIATHTLGCKLNFAETSHIVRQFIESGYQLVDFHQCADLYVINTCTVTAVAEKKCRNAIRQAISLNSNAIVAVIGCFAQNASDEIAKIPGVNLILGNDNKHRLFEIVENSISPNGISASNSTQQDSLNPCVLQNIDIAEPTSFQLSYSMGDRTRTFFKIQDGCDYFCSYCAIPFARGRSRSATIAETVAMAKQIAADGAKELVLTGINTGTFGMRHNEHFIDLLYRLDEVEGIERYRISSIEPNLITTEIIDFVAQSHHFAHHFHIPLQAGSDKVLQLMHRRYNTEFYAEKLQLIKESMPEACIATDLMVGFYGEGEVEFEHTCELIRNLPLSYLHVFTYSERPNTAALHLNERVPVHQRHLRSEIMHEISEQKKRQFYEANALRNEQVLWESDRKGEYMYGFTDNYIRVRTPYMASLVNTLQSVQLTQLGETDVFDVMAH